MEQPTVGTYRVDEALVARRLPDVLALFGAGGDLETSIAHIVLAAAVIEPEAMRGRELVELVVAARAIVGDDYAEGFIDGFGCAWGQRGRSRRYVHGLDDAAAVREALRRLDADWAWMLLEHTQPRL